MKRNRWIGADVAFFLLDTGDAHLLEPLVFGPRPGAPHLPYLHSEATKSYLKLAGPSGVQTLIDIHFTHPSEETANEGDGDPNWTSVFRAYGALHNLRRQREFDQAYETASQFLLHHTPLADIVLRTSQEVIRWNIMSVHGQSTRHKQSPLPQKVSEYLPLK